MNCQNCGAPVSRSGAAQTVACLYCHTMNRLQGEQSLLDGLVLFSDPTGHDCPMCDGALVHGQLDETPVEACQECQGLLLSREEFARVVQTRRATFRGVEEAPRAVPPEELTVRRQCPHCHEPMEVHPYYGPGNVVIDSCHHCQIRWLDPGEITTIERAHGRR